MPKEEKKCPKCGDVTTNIGSIHGFCYPCSDLALKEWQGMKDENDYLLKALEAIRDVGVVIRHESWGAVKSKPTLASVKRFAGEVLAQAKAGER